ncbi:MAG: hypothetical protein IGS38_03700 [Synechococcales cyanobacterium M58_A2018_015]|nr:hypothetical protein [Synechococcales cyanobacterium M58_A2018_015]
MTSKSYEAFNKPLCPPDSPFRDSRFQDEPVAELDNDSAELDYYGAQVASGQTNWSSHWLLLGLSLCCALGGMAVAAFVWLTSLPPVTDCEKVSSQSTEREQLFCAQTAAQSGDLSHLLAGIELVGQWTPDHPLYREAQQSLEDWSKTVLTRARQRHAQGDLQGALELANRIPASSPLYQEAQAKVAEWQQQQQQGEAILRAAQHAMQQRNWEEASRQIRALTELESNYWQFQQFNALSQQLLTERKAWQSLLQARSLAQTNRAQQISAAMTLANQIERDTYAWTAAETNLKQWGETLLKVGVQQWQAGDLESAIALGKQVTLSQALAPEAQNLIKLSEARKLARKSVTHWKASPDQIFHLMEAVAAASQIPPESRFHQLAQATLQHWQAQLQDVTQLHYAQIIASLKQPSTLRIAAQQAQQVAADRPRRVQAQTLIAHWNSEIQRLEDGPYLARAQTLADQNTIAALQSAITLARQILPGRTLYGEAQSAIASWQSQIQVLEDRPLLAEAQQLADQGNWEAAIQVASRVSVGRALYGEAQAAIDNWQAAIWNARNPRKVTPRRQEDPLEAALEEALPSEREDLEALPLPEVAPTPIARPSPATALPPLPTTRPDMTRIEELLQRNRARSLTESEAPLSEPLSESDAIPAAPAHEPSSSEAAPLPVTPSVNAPVPPAETAPAPSIGEDIPPASESAPPLVEGPAAPVNPVNSEPVPLSEFAPDNRPASPDFSQSQEFPQELSQDTTPEFTPEFAVVALSPEETPALLKVEWSSH